MAAVAKLLAPASNYAAVQLPERKHPGVVFQGDSLNSLLSRLHRLRDSVEPVLSEDSTIDFDEMLQDLERVQNHYETVCASHDIKLPYIRV